MNAFRNQLKPIALFLTALLLFQGCVVYHKTPTTLAKASQERTTTQVTHANGEVSKFKYITFEDSHFYGVNTQAGELIKTPLAQEELAQILTKNKTASTWATVALIAIPATAIAVVISTINFYPDTGIDLTD